MIYDTVNPEVIRLILQDARGKMRILDVGCGTGRLGRELKARIKCYLTGIELDAAASEIADDTYDEVIQMDLEALINKSGEFRPVEKYDFIVLGDILEHVTRPEVLLKCFGKALKGGGFLIASIPNVANWMVRFGLFFGNFDYSGGILDVGHLRFFTYKTAKKLLEDSGYRIIRVVNNNHTLLIRLLGRIWKSLFAFQFVFKCVKREEKDLWMK